jgi:hypothetical protein
MTSCNVSEALSRPAIPAKRYFTLAEVAALCVTTEEIIQMLESQLLPDRKSKLAGHRRFYQHHEVLQLRRLSQQPQTHLPALPQSSVGIQHPASWAAESKNKQGLSAIQGIDWMALRMELLEIRSLLSDIEPMSGRF